MPEKLTIVIGGDTCPTRSNENYLINGQEAIVFGRVSDVLSSADVAIVNLECPLTNQDHEIRKAGPCLQASPRTISGLVNAGIRVFSLANNHIMDFRAEGLEDTLDTIAGKGALFVGAGKSLQEARRILKIERKGYRIAVIAVAEHEYSIAGQMSPGANPFDAFDTIEDIGTARAIADVVIVLFHGGLERHRYPSPNLQRVCRKMVNHGADFVICQHSHCIGAYEKYQGGTIVYGQGNLLFDYFDDEMWRTGLLVEMTIGTSGNIVNYIPVVGRGAMIDLADGVAKETILRAFAERSSHVNDRATIDREFAKFAEGRKYAYLQAVLGLRGWWRRIDNRMSNLLTKLLFNKENQPLLYDFLNCESHLEVMKRVLEPRHQDKYG